MKYFALILFFGLCLNCHKPTINQNTKIFEKDILNSYLKYTLSKSTNSNDPEFVEMAQAFVDFQASNDSRNDGTAAAFENLQHIYMTDLVEDMATSLSAFGGSVGINVSFNYYKKLVWGSLQTTNTYQTKFNTFKKKEIEAIFDAEQYNENREYVNINGGFTNITPKGTPVATGTPCN